MYRTTIDEAYENLGNAIIEQACEDWRRDPALRLGVENFFKGAFFNMLTAIDPGALIKMLKEEANEKNYF
jgi:hypothetical protein